ncbi:hypothetical protein [Gandjariella thermophila]|nr:hypothetical protein [Gandjariella thermophila]
MPQPSWPPPAMQPPMQPPPSAPQPGMPISGGMPGLGPQPPWLAMALRRPRFARLVGAEFRKFAATISDRILLVVGPVAMIAFGSLACTQNVFEGTWQAQILPLATILVYGPLVTNCSLVKLVSGEWQYRSAQPTLLVQPSRLRYMAAQSVVALALWIVHALIALVLYSLLAPPSIENRDVQSLLGLRPGAVVATAVVGALVAVAWALIIGLLLPNAAAALTTYLVSVVAFTTLSGLAPNVAAWFSPFRIPLAVAAADDALPPASTYIAAALLVGLALVAVLRYRKREAA